MAELSTMLGTLFGNSALHRYVTSLLKAPDAVDDVLQNVAENLLKHPKAPDKPEHYLFRSARNCAIDHLRSHNTREDYEAQCMHSAESHDAHSPERIVEGEQALACLENALSELPLLSQQIFIMFNVEGKSQKDIARHFDLHLSTVEKRLAKAKAHCFEHIFAHLD